MDGRGARNAPDGHRPGKGQAKMIKPGRYYSIIVTKHMKRKKN